MSDPTRIPKVCLTCGGTVVILVDETRFMGAARGTCRCVDALVSFEVKLAPIIRSDRVSPLDRLRDWVDAEFWAESPFAKLFRRGR